MTETSVIYTRVTQATQSPQEQREQCLEYATEVLDIEPPDILVMSDTSTYARAEQSSDREKLDNLTTEGKIERVIVSDSARIAKNIGDLHKSITQFVDNGVAVHVIEAGLRIGEKGSDGGPDDQTMLRALGIAAEMDAALNSERTKEGIAAAKAEGKHIGRPPFGFDSDGKGGLVPNENFETALAVIEEIEAGESKRSTARRAGITRATVQNVTDRKERYFGYEHEREESN
jgi:DNA invertase Pin-like site-specific DNA recombinase